MVKNKSQSKKQQKRGGIDFKKIKRKVGRRLPPPKNATNTEIKSKAIVLLEQSVVSEKAGLAVSKKGLTLKELLQQTSHHNAKVRRDALIGIRDIFLKYPTELKHHKLAAVEKLRERISDDDKLVRETLYKLFKKVVLPNYKNDNQGPFISSMMAYIFKAMTHLAIDVRVMAFKFLELVVQNYPSSFPLYAEKILQNYEDILLKSQFHLQEQSKLEGILSGLVHCLRLLPPNKRDDASSIENSLMQEVSQKRILHAFDSDALEDSTGMVGITKRLQDILPILVSCFLDAQSFDCMLLIIESINLTIKFSAHEIVKSEKCSSHALSLYGEICGSAVDVQSFPPAVLERLWDVFPLKGDKRYFILNAIVAEVFLSLNERDHPHLPLLEKFLEFLESSLIETASNNMTQSNEVFHERQLLPLVSFIPKLVMRVTDYWRSRILKAFTEVYKSCRLESSLKLACISVLDAILDPEKGWGCLLFSTDPENYLHIWTSELPLLLVLLDDKHPVCSKAVLHLQLNMAKAAMLNISFMQMYDQMQDKFSDFFCSRSDGSACSGPFMRLTMDIQELSLSCVYYFSSLHPKLLGSLASCCLSKAMEPFLLFRVLEILHSTYTAGKVLIADYISFLITLLSQFGAYPADAHPAARQEGFSNRKTYRSLCSAVGSSLLQMGDDHLVFQVLEKIILDRLALRLSADNICGLLRVFISLNSKPTRLSELSVIKLSNILPGYLIHIASSMQDDWEHGSISSSCYYLLPCFLLFSYSSELLYLVLNSLKIVIAEEISLLAPQHTHYTSNHLKSTYTVLSLLLMMHEDMKMKRILLKQKMLVKSIIEEVIKFQSSEELKISTEEGRKIKRGLACLELKLS